MSVNYPVDIADGQSSYRTNSTYIQNIDVLDNFNDTKSIDAIYTGKEARDK